MRISLETFGSDGFDGVSVKDISERCEVSSALIHYYFSSKEILWKASVERGMSKAMSALRLSSEDARDLDPTMRLKFFMRRYINYFAENPSVLAIISRESDGNSARFTWLKERHLRQFYALWTEPISDLRQQDLLRSDAPDYHIALIIVGACYHFLTSRTRVLPVLGVQSDNDRNIVQRHADVVIDIVLNGLLQRG